VSSPVPGAAAGLPTVTRWLVLTVAAIGFLFDTYELLMFPVIGSPAVAEFEQWPREDANRQAVERKKRRIVRTSGLLPRRVDGELLDDGPQSIADGLISQDQWEEKRRVMPDSRCVSRHRSRRAGPIPRLDVSPPNPHPSRPVDVPQAAARWPPVPARLTNPSDFRQTNALVAAR